MLPEPKILLADDDAAILGLLTVISRRAGLEPDTARDGLEAIGRIDANDYAVVFLDLMMPRFNGYQVIEHLRNKAKRPAVIVSTAMNSNTPLDPAVVHIVLRKPFDVDVVGALITEAAKSMSGARSSVRAETAPLQAPIA
jgi:DNA-binding response OmpR family regulator